MADKLKLCKDCKHFYYRGGINEWLFESSCLCNRKTIKVINVITGNVMNTYLNRTSCLDERAAVSHIEDKCGPEGKHWELD